MAIWLVFHGKWKEIYQCKFEYTWECLLSINKNQYGHSNLTRPYIYSRLSQTLMTHFHNAVIIEKNVCRYHVCVLFFLWGYCPFGTHVFPMDNCRSIIDHSGGPTSLGNICNCFNQHGLFDFQPACIEGWRDQNDWWEPWVFKTYSFGRWISETVEQ